MRLRRLLAVAGLTMVVSIGGDDEADEVADFCRVLGDHLGLEAALPEVPAADPGALAHSLATIEPPAAIAADWEAWAQQRRAAVAGYAVRAADGARSFLDAPDPDPAVDGFWERECVQRRGLEPAGFVSATDPELPPYDRAPDGGGVRVVEQGFTETASPLTDQDNYYVTVGIMVENTSDYVAVATGIEVRLRDGSGDRLPHGLGDDGTLSVPVLLPGQRFGVGATDLLDRGGTAELAVAVGEPAQWWPAEHRVAEFAQVTTGELSTIRDSPIELTLRFTIDSGYPVSVGRRTAFAVFRNAAGEIVGGANDPARYPHVRPGRSFGDLRFQDVAQDVVDPSRTKIYL